jgi:hypothetical protein
VGGDRLRRRLKNETETLELHTIALLCYDERLQDIAAFHDLSNFGDAGGWWLLSPPIKTLRFHLELTGVDPLGNAIVP